MTSTGLIIKALSILGSVKCKYCGAYLIVDNEESTVIKHVLVTYKDKETIEINCRGCNRKNYLNSN